MIENEMTVSVPLEVVKASEIEPKEVKWLWYPYIPVGKVTQIVPILCNGASPYRLERRNCSGKRYELRQSEAVFSCQHRRNRTAQ